MSNLRYFPKRTHSSSALAFKGHCDYACPVEHHKPRLSRVWKWLFWTIVGLSIVAFSFQIGAF